MERQGKGVNEVSVKELVKKSRCGARGMLVKVLGDAGEASMGCVVLP